MSTLLSHHLQLNGFQSFDLTETKVVRIERIKNTPKYSIRNTFLGTHELLSIKYLQVKDDNIL